MRLSLILVVVALMLLALIPAAQAITSCPKCNYRISNGAVECPKCLKLIGWPYAPPRDRRATIIVRTGTDAFIRDRHSQNRQFRYDRNAGGDIRGPVGSWGGPTTLRYLIKFDIPAAFAAAQIDMKTFKPRRAILKLYVADKGNNKGDLPVRIYPLTREFQQGSHMREIRPEAINGCTWFYAAPLMVWYREGGDYDEKISCRGTLSEEGASSIDVTEIFSQRFAEFHDNEVFNDPGLIIMRDPHAFGDYGYLNIFSFEMTNRRVGVKSPELFLE